MMCLMISLLVKVQLKMCPEKLLLQVAHFLYLECGMEPLSKLCLLARHGPLRQGWWGRTETFLLFCVVMANRSIWLICSQPIQYAGSSDVDRTLQSCWEILVIWEELVLIQFILCHCCHSNFLLQETKKEYNFYLLTESLNWVGGEGNLVSSITCWTKTPRMHSQASG